LLLVIFAGALFIAVRIYAELASAASVETSLVTTRAELDDALRQQIEEQDALRGYLLTGDDSFQGPYEEGDRAFDQDIDSLSAEIEDLTDPELSATIRQLRDVHERWESEVAVPLMHHRAADVTATEKAGKMMVDQARDDASRIGALLKVRLDTAQTSLRRRIDESLFSILALSIVFASAAIAFVATRARLQARIDRERAIVETLEGAFRNDLDALAGAHIGSAYSSATRDAAVGGDLFDVRRLDERTGLILVADVSGKGIDAAVDTAFVKYSLRTLARVERDPAVLMAQFNALFLDTIRDPSTFVVVFAGVFDGATRRLSYSSAGHGGAFIRRGGVVRELEVTGPAIGLDASMTFAGAALDLEPGDLLVLATDGFTEARDPAGNMLGARALEFLRAAPTEPQACADGLVAALRAYSGGRLADDLALLVVGVDGEPARAG